VRLRWHHLALWAALVLGMLLLPYLVGNGTLRTMIFANYLAIFAISWDVLSGRTGYVSFGHPFLIGIGAYTTAILTKRFDVPVEISIPLAVVATMVGGLIVLLPALRIKGSYFALVTLAFMELMYQLVQVIRPDLTGGTRGIGKGMAREFLKRGHQVAVCGRSADSAAAAAVAGIGIHFQFGLLPRHLQPDIRREPGILQRIVVAARLRGNA